MMKLFAALLLPALAALAMTTPVMAAPAMWEVRDDDSAIWVFGSIHVLPAGSTWRTPLFETVLADADKVVFETDVRPEAMAEIGAQAFVRGIYVDGTLLTDLIDDQLEVQLRMQMAKINVPMGSILAMKPWMATNTISAAGFIAAGYVEQGVEFILEPELTPERMVFLETGEEQIDVLAGGDEDEQIATLEATLEQIDLLPKLMSKMLSNWSGGTPERLAAMFEVEMSGFEEAFLERLLYARNRNWMTPLEAMLADNQENLVIVGAAHLVGEGSVLDLLEQAGYEVERIQ
jgi:uncharacterized protein YbaP (TraB family)